MASKGGPNKITDGLVLHIDTGNTQKGFMGEPTYNWIDNQNAVARSSYNTWVGPNSGNFRSNHPRAIIAHNAQGSQLAGYYNGGVGDATNTHHAHWVYDESVRKPVVQLRDLDGQWKAKSWGLGLTPTQLGLSHGDSYTISWDQWSSITGKGADVGLYQGEFHDGRSYNSTVQQKAGVWERKSKTFTLSTSFNLTTNVSIYMYGHYQKRGILRIANVQFETKDHATPYAAPSRSTSGSLFDLTGNNEIDMSNVSFSSGSIVFDGTDDDIDAGPATSSSLQRTIEMVFNTYSHNANYMPIAVYTRGGNQSVVAGKRMWLGIQSGKFRMHGWGTSDPDSTTTIQTGKYYHAVYAYDQSTKKHFIWINGVLEDNSTNTQGGFTSWNNSGDHHWFIGGDPDHANWTSAAGRSMDGEVPIFKVYDRILSTEEVNKNYNAIRARFGI